MRRSVFSVLVLSTFAIGCTGGAGMSTDPERGTARIETWSGELPISAPWLRDQLPTGILSYQRIPHPLGMLGIPKGNIFDLALSSEANIINLISIQQGLAQNLAGDLPAMADPRMAFFLEHLRSPIEVAAVGFPVPSAMIAVTLDIRSDADFEAMMAELAQLPPFIGIAAPLDADGFADITGIPVPQITASVNFDADTGRLALFVGQGASRAAFASMLAVNADGPAHPMRALESQIDSSGQGLFGWVDAAQALGIAAMATPPEVAQTLAMTGANQMRALAFGTGIADGKGRLKLLADFGTDRTTRPFPVIENSVSASSVGDPTGLFLMSIPSVAEFTRLESLALSHLPPEAGSQWEAVKGAFSTASGVSIEELLSAIGPELIAFSDSAGDYIGLKVRDSGLLDDVLGRVTASAGVAIEDHRVDGETIRQLDLPGTFGLPSPAAAGEAAPFLSVLSRMKNRMFWVEEDEYLYLTGVPQLLMDRIRLGPDTSIAGWLGETQRFDVSSSLFAVTGSIPKIPQMVYQAYLGTMQSLADLVDVEYDIWAMPTARELGLPDRSTVGLSLNLGEPYVSLELSYESHPAEMLFGGGGLAAVAGAGIVAAIAMPAYQDYTIRAQVSEGLNLAAAPKAAVAETWLTGGVAAANREAAGMTADSGDSGGRYVAGVDIVDGQIQVHYGNAAHGQLAGTTLAITPFSAADGSIVWVCGHASAPAGLDPIGAATTDMTTIEPQYLPSACRP